MAKQEILISQNLAEDLNEQIKKVNADKVFLLMDKTTEHLCFPLIAECAAIKDNCIPIVIEPTDTHKNIETLVEVWKILGEKGGSRHSLLVCLGGGMVTDLGGFAASTFKRGITYINIPTTLLSMVDAAVGGKTGINFNSLKNEIGVFNKSSAVIIDTNFLRTLDYKNNCSGYAEMLKHALIKNKKMWNELLTFDLEQIDYPLLQRFVDDSIRVKEAIVEEDPFEKGIRKALNLGHTVGHALESHAMHINKPVLHGYAVAWGLACELYLSNKFLGFPQKELSKYIQFLKEYYGSGAITCDNYEQLYAYMQHDKKNENGVINFTLLHDVGEIALNQTATKDAIFEMFDFFREMV